MDCGYFYLELPPTYFVFSNSRKLCIWCCLTSKLNTWSTMTLFTQFSLCNFLSLWSPTSSSSITSLVPLIISWSIGKNKKIHPISISKRDKTKRKFQFGGGFFSSMSSMNLPYLVSWIWSSSLCSACYFLRVWIGSTSHTKSPTPLISMENFNQP